MKKRSVLIIDDDQWLTMQFTRLLNRAGFEVDVAPNAIDGISMVDTRHPDVIVLDMFMPGPNGLVLLHELQSHDDIGKIPVILCTNSASDIAGNDVAAYGVARVLDKTTMHPDDIVAAVKKVLL